ncbi:MAG: dienelactone hydrolase family protein [Planctomycetes bacterium]|nr:dienelactone hydrolase family protein [Planctomycetota bacterium]
MRCTSRILSALLFLSQTTILHAEDPRPGQQVAQVFQSVKSPGSKLGYWLSLPGNYGQPNQTYPLLMFLHGSGERGDDLSRVKKHGPPKLIGEGQSLPFVVVSPQCPADQHWEPEILLELLDQLQAKYAIDPTREYITGLSMGGGGTWSLLQAAPKRFAAAVSICGGANPMKADAALHTPLWIVVGDRDSATTVANSRATAEALKLKNADVKLTVMSGIGHDSWTQTYATPELYEWMLRHRRAD